MLDDLFGSAARVRVLEALLASGREPLHVRELIRRCDVGASGVQREVARLERIGLVRSVLDEQGRRQISVVDGHPLLDPLRALLAAAGQDRSVGSPGTRVPLQDSVMRVNPHLRGKLDAIVVACRRGAVERAVLVGSGADSSALVEPRDVDVVVRLGGPLEGRAARYFALRRALEDALGLPVDLIEEGAVANPYLREEFARTGVVLVEAA